MLYTALQNIGGEKNRLSTSSFKSSHEKWGLRIEKPQGHVSLDPILRILSWIPLFSVDLNPDG